MAINFVQIYTLDRHVSLSSCFHFRSSVPSIIRRSHGISSSTKALNLRPCGFPFTSVIKRSPGLKACSSVLQSSLEMKNMAVELAHQLKGTSIFLVGISNTMKTEVGKALADALRYYYFDSDSLVEQAGGSESGMKPFRIRDSEGFKEAESEVLKQLSSMGRLVVCAGDGAVQTSTNLAYLRHGILVWIDISLELLAKEVVDGKFYCPSTWNISASDTFSEVMDKLSKVYFELREGYATADATVSLRRVTTELGYDGMEFVTPEDMATQVLKEIQGLTRVKKMMEEAARPF